MIDWKNISQKDLAGYICEELKKQKIDSVLVGGACVSIYSNNQYISNDLDFVSYHDRDSLKQVLVHLGFEDQGKYYKHSDCPWLIEFVAPPVAVGDYFVTDFHYIKTQYGTVKLLKPVDCIKDRLASYFHWDDKQSLEQAVLICKAHDIDLDELKNWAEAERQETKFQKFLKVIKT